MKAATVMLIGALAAGVAQASDPIGIYALIDKVVMEPNDANPERIQVWGTFAIAQPNDSNYYQAPQRGYLYFRLPASATVARNEWNDLKSVAGTGKVVAFGTRWAATKPTMRKADQKPENPDAYEIGNGVVKVRSDTEYAPIKSLLQSLGH
jgi:hypothetical protein